jgi:predicted amidohydrolase
VSISQFPYTVVQHGEQSPEGLSIAVANVTPVRDKAINLAKYQCFIRHASELGASLIVFPEQALQGYLWARDPGLTLDSEVFEYHYQHAETMTGPALSAIAQSCREKDIHVAIGFTEAMPVYGGGIAGLFNSMALIGPTGAVGVYRKVHQPGAELHIYRAGRSFPVYQTPFGRVGMLVCYDIAFPEAALSYAIRGADIIVFGTAWTYSGPLAASGANVQDYQGDLYDTFVKSRAAENQLWLVAADCAGRDDLMPWHYYGHSRVINPGGIVVAEIGDDEGLLVVHGLRIRDEILAARTRYFGGLNIIADRVPDAYSAVTDTSWMYPDYRTDDASREGVTP